MNLGGIEMNRRIEDALRLRLSVVRYLRAAKKVDNTIYDFELKRYGEVVMKTDPFPVWKEWQQLADAYQKAKDKISDCDRERKIPILMKKTQSKLEDLLEKTIIEAVTEVLLCDFNVDRIIVCKSGLQIYSSENFSYRSKYNTRYKMPNKVLQIINSADGYPVFTYQLIERVMYEFAYENLNDTEYLKYDTEQGVPTIIIRIPKD